MICQCASSSVSTPPLYSLVLKLGFFSSSAEFVDLEEACYRVSIEELWYCMGKSKVTDVRLVQDIYCIVKG